MSTKLMVLEGLWLWPLALAFGFWSLVFGLWLLVFRLTLRSEITNLRSEIGRPKTGGQRSKIKDQRSKTKGQRPKVKDQRSKTKDQRPKIKDYELRVHKPNRMYTSLTASTVQSARLLVTTSAPADRRSASPTVFVIPSVRMPAAFAD